MPTNVHPAYVPPRQWAPVPSRKAELTPRARHQEIVANKTTEKSFNIIETKDEGIQSCKAFTPMKQQRPINYEPFGEDHFDGITTVLNQQPGKVSHQLQYLDNSVSDGWQIEDLTDLQMNESNKQVKRSRVLIPTDSNGQQFKESNIKIINEPLTKLTQQLLYVYIKKTYALTGQDNVNLDSIEVEIPNFHLFDKLVSQTPNSRVKNNRKIKAILG